MDFTDFEWTGPIIIAIVLAVAFIIFIIYAIVKGQRRKLSAGVEDMIGKEAVAQTPLNPTGTVLAEGELWTAIAEDSKIEAGEEVTITKVEGLKLWVTKKSKEKEEK
ncbi:MAG: NfeD family protein [Chloroflexota bacterium]|nr:MAG: NfeD family protein [Chloroflexota bacterium]